MRDWTARDWRMMAGVCLLGLGGVVVTALAAYALSVIAEKSTGPWPAAYFGYGCLVLIGIVLTGFSAILGRRVFKFRVGDNEVSAVGEEAERILDKTE